MYYRGHYLKYHSEISKNKIDTISSLIEMQIYGLLYKIIWYRHLQSTALKHNLITG